MAPSKDLIAVLEPLVRRVRTDATAVKGNNGVAWTDEPLTEARLAKHLNGGPARGVCPIKAGESVTMVAVLDFDSHKGESSWDEMAEAAERVSSELSARGLRPVPWRSSGGRGIHLIMLWDEPQDAHSVRVLLVEALAACGFANGNAGVSRKQIEVFPKQNSVELGKYGSQFILPLAGHSELLFPELGWEALGKDAALGMVWPSSDPVPVVEKAQRASSAIVVKDRSMLDRALMAIPNDIDDRDAWFVLMCAYAEGGGDKEVARAWSSQHGSHKDELFDKAWDSITVGKEGGTPVGYLFTVAEAHGFDEHILSDFEVVGPKPGELAPPKFKRGKGNDTSILATVTNAVQALARPDLIGMRIAHDVFRDEMMVSRPGADEWRAITDADMVTLRMAMERLGFKAAPKELARDAAVRVAADNEFDTAILWASSLQWDGVPRVERFLVDYLGCEDTPYTRAVGRYMWSAMAGRALVPGVQADMAPIFKGGQGLRKSSLIRALVPSDEFYAEVDFSAKEEDTVRNLRGVLVAEIAELSGLHTRALESIKKFMTRRVEKWVPKFKEFSTSFKRRSIFIGSTNEDEILADTTGNRRWLPVVVSKADVEGVVRDRLQLWAEGVALFKANGVCWQAAEALADGAHSQFRIADSWEDAILRWLDRVADDFDEQTGAKNKDIPFTTEAVLRYALDVTVGAQDRALQRRAAAALRSLGYESTTVRNPADGKVVRRWVKRVEQGCNASCNATDVTDNLV